MGPDCLIRKVPQNHPCHAQDALQFQAFAARLPILDENIKAYQHLQATGVTGRKPLVCGGYRLLCMSLSAHRYGTGTSSWNAPRFQM